MSMFTVKFKIKGKLLAVVLGVFVAFLVVVIYFNSIILTIILAIFMFIFLRLAKSYAVAKEEIERVLPQNIYKNAKFEDVYDKTPWKVADEDGKTYNTELLDQTCDCAEFADFHQHYPVGDFRRICRHQVKGYVDSGRLNSLSEPARYLVGEAYKKGEGVSFREILVSKLGQNPSLFYFDEEANVAALIYKEGVGGTYEEYRLRMDDGTWENGFEPPYGKYMQQTLEGWRFRAEKAAKEALERENQ